MKVVLSKLWPWQVQSNTSDRNSTTVSMYSRHENFEASHDVHSPLRYSEVVASRPNRSEEDLNKQTRKMPGLLRLNSIGEDSSVHHTKERCLKQTILRPNLHTSKSFDSVVSSFSRPLFSNMGTVKTFTPVNATFGHPKSKSHSFSEVLQNSRPKSMGSLGGSGLGSSFDSSQSSINQASCFPWQSRNHFKMQKLNSSVCARSDSEMKSRPTAANDKMKCGMTDSSVNMPFFVPLSCAVMSAVSSLYTDSSAQTRMQPVPNIPPQSCSTASGEYILNQLSSVHKTSLTQKVPDSNQRICDISNVQSELPPSVSKSPARQTSENSDACASFSEKISNDKSLPSVKEARLTSSPVWTECESKSCEQSSDKSDLDHGKSKNHKVSSIKNTCVVPMKQGVVCLTSALLTPRKTTKKGRPSSKKQKKRLREKQKQVAHSSPVNESCDKTESKANLSQESSSVVFQSPDVVDGSLDSTSSSFQESPQKQSTPVKSPSTAKGAAGRFFLVPDDDECSDDDSDWSTDESLGGCISPIKGVNFSVALNLDSIFKQKNIPSLKSVLSQEESESDSEVTRSDSCSGNKRNSLCVTVRVSCSEDDSQENNGASSFSSAFNDHSLLGFTAGLCLDNIFKKKPSEKTADDKSMQHMVDSIISKESGQSIDGPRSNAASLEKMDEINAKWDEVYPTAGSRSCHSVTADVITDPNVKVRFATDPYLNTVHEVGDEDRGGTWHLLALDRERFNRRIQDVEAVVGPVLEDSHRMKIFERNRCLMEKMSDSH